MPTLFIAAAETKENRIMKIRATWLAIIPALLCSFSAWAEPPQASKPTASEVILENVAKIKVGSSTREQIKELLGTPVRMTNYGDCNPVDYQEIWEYLGHDANGIFKIHIEFDESGIARIVAKDAKKGPIVVLAAAPKPELQHQHANPGG
jgi:outer membrane protein assembly factor BamE (lipoprotein component of BamABCDE complex)